MDSEQPKKNMMVSLTIDQYLSIIELAKADGVRPGESMDKYLAIVMYEENIGPIGYTDKDIDLVTGDLRERGKKVLNMNELQKKIKKDDDGPCEMR